MGEELPPQVGRRSAPLIEPVQRIVQDSNHRGGVTTSAQAGDLTRRHIGSLLKLTGASEVIGGLDHVALGTLVPLGHGQMPAALANQVQREACVEVVMEE